MRLIEEIFWQTVILGTLGVVISYVVWKLKGSKTDFGEFLRKNGEMLAYLGLLIIVLVMVITRSMNDNAAL